jgi:S-methylmethionine-dependent homocysteine/selenocysteine methylase
MPLQDITLLDGGMGRELLRIGAPFRQPEWSALALLQGPEFVRQVHESYIAAGAEVITSNSFAIVPFHVGERIFATRGRELADLAGRLGRAAIADAPRHKVRLAGSLPPVFGAYRPDLFVAERAQGILGPLVEGLAPHVDLWLAETQSSIAEARAARDAVFAAAARPLWISFTLDDTHFSAVALGTNKPRLRSGESVQEAALAACELGAEALLFNCSHAAVMEAAVREAASVFAGRPGAPRLGVYANAFDPDSEEGAAANEGLTDLRKDLDPSAYLGFARKWQNVGASIIGGCCGIGPEHISVLSTLLKEQA